MGGLHNQRYKDSSKSSKNGLAKDKGRAAADIRGQQPSFRAEGQPTSH